MFVTENTISYTRSASSSACTTPVVVTVTTAEPNSTSSPTILSAGSSVASSAAVSSVSSVSLSVSACDSSARYLQNKLLKPSLQIEQTPLIFSSL
ncbi:hypothetical protein KP78_17050 [Jeotgalibacillus soli]|uniref:Uncharacterized protein n=1 Tax=Jeotgalibacillus soli TaxID=889306 RepID=A0A0C2VW96_9BACL|nr:hypothetical protein KP78_17050 [Jeotgalibacillus soli]